MTVGALFCFKQTICQNSLVSFVSFFAILPKSSAMSSSDLPSDIEEAAQMAVSSLLPSKSKEKYEKVYQRFICWCSEKNIKNMFQEKVLLACFETISKSYSSSSLWAFYSMLRAVISTKNNIDISKFIQLQALLKRKSEGYKPKKSKTFLKEEIAQFLMTADDTKFLLTKVGLIIGIAGACRKQELTQLTCDNVKDEGNIFHVQIPNTKTKISREFFVTSGGIEGIDMVKIVRKYKSLRPPSTDHTRFFVSYRKGACTRQPVGINTFGAMPKVIATFLNLRHPEEYTGHCFRRSSTSMLADSGADLLTVKRHGGWKSNSVAEGYIDTSKENKKKVAKQILGVEPSSFDSSSISASAGTHANSGPSCNLTSFNVQNMPTSGVNVTFNIYK